jgi:hypothetical protein
MKIKVDEMLKEEGWVEVDNKPLPVKDNEFFSFVTKSELGTEQPDRNYFPLPAAWLELFAWDDSTDPEDIVTHFKVFTKEEADKIWNDVDPMTFLNFTMEVANR